MDLSNLELFEARTDTDGDAILFARDPCSGKTMASHNADAQWSWTSILRLTAGEVAVVVYSSGLIWTGGIVRSIAQLQDAEPMSP